MPEAWVDVLRFDEGETIDWTGDVSTEAGPFVATVRHIKARA